MVGGGRILDGMERSCKMVPRAASIAEAGYQARDEKIHKHGKAALPL